MDNIKKNTFLVAVLLFIVTALMYSMNINRALHPDELYHILAARGIVETGLPQIAEGRYDRAYYYTWMLSKLYEWFGESVAISRMPSIVFVSALTSLLFLWLNATAGFSTAVIGSTLFCTSPFAVEAALFTRFYGLQALLFFIGVTLSYTASGKSEGRVVQVLGSIALFLMATYLQFTTLIGVAAFGLWVLSIAYIELCEKYAKFKWRAPLTLLFFLACVGVFAASTGLLTKVWLHYRYVPEWNASLVNAFWFYIEVYFKNYPVLVASIGLIGLSAVVFRPKPASLCLTIFFVSLAISSFAGSKGERYIIYVQPFFFGMVGIGLASLLLPLLTWLRQLRGSLAALMSIGSTPSMRLSTAILIPLVLLLVVVNPGFARTFVRLSGFSSTVDWHASKEDLHPWLSNVDTVVTLAELEMLYYFGEYDFLYSRSRLLENGSDAADFHPDFRTGLPVVGSLEGISQVMRCHATGIITTSRYRWSTPAYMPLDVKDHIIENTREIKLPAHSQILAFVWDETVLDTSLDDYFNMNACLSIPGFLKVPERRTVNPLPLGDGQVK